MRHVVQDCLHNCFPGPPDYWNWLLYHTIMGLDLSTPPRSSRPLNHMFAMAQKEAEANLKDTQAKQRADEQRAQAASQGDRAALGQIQHGSSQLQLRVELGHSLLRRLLRRMRL